MPHLRPPPHPHHLPPPFQIGVMFGNPETTSGGNALKYYSSVRIDIRKKETLSESDQVGVGRELVCARGGGVTRTLR